MWSLKEETMMNRQRNTLRKPLVLPQPLTILGQFLTTVSLQAQAVCPVVLLTRIL